MILINISQACTTNFAGLNVLNENEKFLIERTLLVDEIFYKPRIHLYRKITTLNNCSDLHHCKIQSNQKKNVAEYKYFILFIY